MSIFDEESNKIAEGVIEELKAENAKLKELLKNAVVAHTEAEPMIHAYWIELPKALNPNENPCKCSNCGHVLSFYNGYPKSKYCDTCGAKMKQEE